MEHDHFRGRNIIITGAAGGIGAAVSRHLAQIGAHVLMADQDGAAVQQLAYSLRAEGFAAHAQEVDVTSWASCQRLVERCLTDGRRLDGLVNAAGVMYLARPWEESGGERARRLLEVNLLGSYHMGIQTLTHMQRQGGGAIVNVTSGTQAGMAAGGAYSASKGGIAALTYAWAMDTAAHGVRVNAISPVATTLLTQVTDAYLRKHGQLVGERPYVDPASNAPIVAFLLSPLAHRVNGQIFRVHGDELQLMSHPAAMLPIMRREVWDASSIAHAIDEAFPDSLVPLGLTGIEATFRPLDKVLQVPL
jgi:NAD(P)-dependent dehydrogenase (short-subunit alcohol dehydrogenase family)